MDSVFLISATVYAGLFWAIAWRYPDVALALIFGLAPFQNDLAGGLGGVKFSFSEVNLVLVLPLLLILFLQGERKAKLWPFFWPCAFYFSVCLASSLIEWRGGATMTSLVQTLLFMFVLVWVFSNLGRRPKDFLPALWTLLFVATFFAVLLIATRQQFVLGIHKNGIGGSIACALLVAFELFFHYQNKLSWHKWVVGCLLLVLAAGLMISLSRGAWMGAIGGFLLIVAMRRQFVLLTRMVLFIIPVMGLAWNLLPQESREYATNFDSKRGNISQRYKNDDAAIAQWQKNPLLGSGVGIRKQYDATQLVLFTLAETGVIGLVAFTASFVLFFMMVWKTQKRIGRDDLGYSLLAIGGALMMSRLLHGMVDHYWTRGPTAMAWASAGMATTTFWRGSEQTLTHRIARARALLALHLLEMKRNAQRGLKPTPLSRLELARANQALDVLKQEVTTARGVGCAARLQPALGVQPDLSAEREQRRPES